MEATPTPRGRQEHDLTPEILTGDCEILPRNDHRCAGSGETAGRFTNRLYPFSGAATLLARDATLIATVVQAILPVLIQLVDAHLEYPLRRFVNGYSVLE